MEELIKMVYDFNNRIEKLEQEVKNLSKNNTYSITINTHDCEKSPEDVQKFLEKFINGIKEKGTNL